MVSILANDIMNKVNNQIWYDTRKEYEDKTNDHGFGGASYYWFGSILSVQNLAERLMLETEEKLK